MFCNILRLGLRKSPFAAFTMAACLVAAAAHAQPGAPQQLNGLPDLPNSVTLPAQNGTAEMVIPLDKSQLLRLDRAFNEISVGNPEIADVVPLTRNLIYVLGKKRGATNLTLSDNAGNIFAVVDVIVSYDVEEMGRSLSSLVPDEKVSIRTAGNAVVLSGQVSSTDKLRQILSVAERYAPGAVTNLMTVGSPQQVLLQVRFAEIQRNASKNLGANLLAQLTPAEGTFTVDSGLGIPSTTFGTISALAGDGRYRIAAAIDALEKKGLLRTLAEPNLVALSGDTANFLAGGQIPIPAPQSGIASAGGIPVITVTYKDFGVSLSFTPTVIGKEQINLELVSEVSEIDPTVSINTGIVSIPGLKVRRARTTIELKDGESFSIAGLLQDDFQDGVQEFPWLGRIPVLGTLFRSTNFQHQQTELVVLITAHLVDPAVAKSFATPADAVVLPSESSLFGKGNTTEQGAETPVKGSSGFVLP